MNGATSDQLITALAEQDFTVAADLLGAADPFDARMFLERLDLNERAIAFRLLEKNRALAVFEGFSPSLQRELVGALGEADVADVFQQMNLDDRVELLDELPAKIAGRMVRYLTPGERQLTSVVLGYPQGSIGRRMSPEYFRAVPDETVGEVLDRLSATEAGSDDETMYVVPVSSPSRTLLGVVDLTALLRAPRYDEVGAHMGPAVSVFAEDGAEAAARQLVDRRLFGLSVTDREGGVVGLVTVDDALRILDQAQEEDEARAGSREPLRRPYLSTPVRTITRSRIVWLFILGLSAILTVNVLEVFEATLEQRVTLALFIPLLTGIGGNTGSQAATTVTRALATGQVRVGDIGRIAFKEVRAGLAMGAILGAVGGLVAGLVYDAGLGWVIGLTLLGICSMAATVGGSMPLLAKAARVDPAVVSTPFITTFCDATGLLLYFSIAQVVLGL